MDEFQPRRRHRRSREKNRIPKKRRQVVIIVIVVAIMAAMVYATLMHGSNGFSGGSDVDQFGRTMNDKPS